MEFEKKWSKWMLKDTDASDYDKSVIAGHYVFSTPEVDALKDEARQKLTKQGANLDQYLKDSVKESIYRYMKSFRLLKTNH